MSAAFLARKITFSLLISDGEKKLQNLGKRYEIFYLLSIKDLSCRVVEGSVGISMWKMISNWNSGKRQWMHVLSVVFHDWFPNCPLMTPNY